MASKIKKSKERIKILEEHIWAGCNAGLKATENQSNSSEMVDVLLRIAQSINSANHRQNVSGDPGTESIKISE